MKTDRRVVVTGYGAISAMGNNVNEIWQGLMNYEVGYSKFDFSDDGVNGKYFGFFDLEHSQLKSFSKKLLKQAPLFAKYSLIACREAIEMALNGGELDDIAEPFERGTMIGTGYGAIDIIY